MYDYGRYASWASVGLRLLYFIINGKFIWSEGFFWHWIDFLPDLLFLVDDSLSQFFEIEVLSYTQHMIFK